MTTTSLRRFLLFLFAATLVGCDHGTKALAAVSLARAPLPVFGDVVDVRFTKNPDVAFSMLGRLGIPHAPGLLLAASAVVTVLVTATWWLRSRARRAGLLDHVGYALVLAGAVGNALDRAFRGYVVDIVRVGAWPVFNVADVAVVLGMALLAFAALRGRGRSSGPPSGGARPVETRGA